MQASGDRTLTRVASRDGTEIGYFSSGSGPPLLLVHGALGDHSRWDGLRPLLEPHVTMHAMDRRGRGASSDAESYSGEREAEDVAAVVESIARASGTKVAVWGSSGGASMALAAAQLTNEIGRLVLFEPPGPAQGSLMARLADELDALLAAGDREGVLVTAYRAGLELSDEQIEQLRSAPAWPNRLAAAHTVPRELRTSADLLFEHARNTAAPTLVIVGGATAEAFRTTADSVIAALPDASLIEIDGQGHGAELGAAELVVGHVLQFLGRAPRADGAAAADDAGPAGGAAP